MRSPADRTDLHVRRRPIRPGGLAAFGVPVGAGGEKLVILVENREKDVSGDERDEIAAAVRRRLFETHRLAVHTVRVGRRGLVLKTTSGKLRRGACRQEFLRGEEVPA